MKVSLPHEKEITDNLMSDGWKMQNEKIDGKALFETWTHPQKTPGVIRFNRRDMHKRVLYKIAKQAGWLERIAQKDTAHASADAEALHEISEDESKSALLKEIKGLRLAIAAAERKEALHKEASTLLERRIAGMEEAQQAAAQEAEQTGNQKLSDAQARCVQLRDENEELRKALYHAIRLVEEVNKRQWEHERRAGQAQLPDEALPTVGAGANVRPHRAAGG